MSFTLLNSTSLLSNVNNFPCPCEVGVADPGTSPAVLLSATVQSTDVHAELIAPCRAANRTETQALHLVNKKAKSSNTTSMLNDGLDQAVELPPRLDRRSGCGFGDGGRGAY